MPTLLTFAFIIKILGTDQLAACYSMRKALLEGVELLNLTKIFLQKNVIAVVLFLSIHSYTNLKRQNLFFEDNETFMASSLSKCFCAYCSRL